MSTPAYRFRLYVLGGRVGSERAESDLRAVLDGCVPGGRYVLEVVDLAAEPARAAADSVIAAPTVLRLQPGPERRIVGDLSDAKVVCEALGLGAGKPELDR